MPSASGSVADLLRRFNSHLHVADLPAVRFPDLKLAIAAQLGPFTGKDVEKQTADSSLRNFGPETEYCRQLKGMVLHLAAGLATSDHT